MIDYVVNGTYYIDDNLLNRDEVKEKVARAVADYQAWQKKQLGRDINPDELRKRVLNSGAYRVEMTAPTYTPVARDQVAHCTGCSMELGV